MSDMAPGYVLHPFCNDTDFSSIKNYYSENCINYSVNYINDDLSNSEQAIKIIFEQDRLLDVDLANASYDLLLYNYAHEQYVVFRLGFEVQTGGGVSIT